jgi:hypothetical protein
MMYMYGVCMYIVVNPLPCNGSSRGHTTGYDLFLALTILVQVWQVDFITEEYDPLAQLYGGHDYSIGGAPILAVVVKRLQE